MVMVISVSVIFDTGYNYLCYSNKGYFVDIEEKKSPINIEVMANGPLPPYEPWSADYGFGIFQGFFKPILQNIATVTYIASWTHTWFHPAILLL